MKRVRTILIVFLIILASLILIGAGETYGVDRTLKATLIRPYSDDDKDGTPADDYYEIQRAAKQKIYKIYQEYGTAETLQYPDAIYCLRASIGFGNSDYDVLNNSVLYTVIGDMRADRTIVRSNYNTITGINMSDANYNAILWIIDQMYLPRHKAYTGGVVDNTKSRAEREELKARLLSAAGISPTATSLTDDDIEVIQQMAIWYFSNFDQNGQSNSLSLALPSAGGPILSSIMLINGNPVVDPGMRMMDIQRLYMYLVEGAIANAGTTKIAPNIEFTSTNPKIKEATISPGIPYYIVGPFELTNSGGNDFDLTSTIRYKRGSGITGTTTIDNTYGTVFITNSTGTDLSRNKQLKDMVNAGAFYIALSKAGYNNLEELSIDINYSYWQTTKAEYMSAGVGEQPVVLIEKAKVFGDTTITARGIEGQFNLHIRKVDENGNLITNNPATFTIRALEGGSAIPVPIGLDGTATTGYIGITSVGQIFRYELIETTPPGGYIGMPGKAIIKITTALNGAGTAYEVVNVELESGTGINTTQIEIPTIVGNTVEITVINEEIEGGFNLEIEKRAGTVTGELIRNNPATFLVNKTEPEVKTKTYYTQTTGKVTLDVETITANGQIFKYQITEQEAPAGYIGYVGTIYVVVETAEVSGSYVVVDQYLTNDVGTRLPNTTKLAINRTGNTITIAVANEEIEGLFNLEIEKREETVSGEFIKNNPATFLVNKTEPEVKTKTYYTQATGKVMLDTETITADGQIFKYQITEEEAPSGYIGYEGIIYVVVETAEVSGSYVVVDQYLTNGVGTKLQNTDMLSISKRGNTITISVANEEITGWFNLEIIKVDEDGNAIVDNPAIFTLRLLESGIPVEFPTESNGKATTVNIPIETEGQIFRYELIEIKAPDGYVGMEGKGIMKVITARNNGEYIVVDVQKESGTGVNTEDIKVDIVGNTIVIEVTNKEPEGSFNLQIRKVDEQGNLIKNNKATFTLRLLETGSPVTYETGTDGTVTTGYVEITEDGQIFRYELIEIEAPNGYIAMEGKGIIKVITAFEDGVYKVVDVQKESGTGLNTSDIEVNIVGNTVVITVKDEKIGVFDLALRKFITKVNGVSLADTRVPNIDPTTINNSAIPGHTAEYKHKKDPVSVETGDIVTYEIAVYNEGDIRGYVTEIKDYLPIGLEPELDDNPDFLSEEAIEEFEEHIIASGHSPYATEGSCQICKSFKEEVDASKYTYSYNPTEHVLTITPKYQYASYVPMVGPTPHIFDIEAYSGTGALPSKKLEIKCNVIAEEGNEDKILTNVATMRYTSKAEVTADSEIPDIDSSPDVFTKPSQTTLPSYKGNNGNKSDLRDRDYHYKGQEDDDDFEKVVIRAKEVHKFDLALRKFITKVDDKAITSRIPKVEVDQNGKITYVHTKDPVEVANGNIVTYTIRVYNEGTKAGYAEEVRDDIPEGLQYLPEHATNKKYEWKMYYVEGGTLVETNDVTKATEIRTEYLSSAKESSTRQNEIKAFNPYSDVSTVTPLNPDYRDIEVAFAVIEPNTSSRIIINTAEISDDSDDDIDSIPDNNKNGEDDIDKEYIYVRYFDLSLIKWVSKAVVTVDGKTTTTSYEMPVDDPRSEYVVKVDLDKKTLDKTTVKFVYTIMVINEGEIAGYAKEITDDIPEGLLFVEEDNPTWSKGEGNKVTTKALENTLLQPGENAKVDITLTWKKDGANVGLKKNTAEISKDDNEYGAKDKDSKPNNWDEKEDDQDFALVILTIRTGGAVVVCIPVIGMVLTTLLGGVTLIKRYVLI